MAYTRHCAQSWSVSAGSPHSVNIAHWCPFLRSFVNSLPLGRYFGIQVYVHWTFLILVFVMLLPSFRGAPDLTTALRDAGEELIFLLTIFFCVTLHEFGHALAARRFGIRTRDIILWPLGGLARLEGMKWTPTSELVIAIAGPLVNVVIACVLLIVIFIQMGFSNLPDPTVDPPATFIEKVCLLNILLVAFNMIPAFPMDGGRVLRALLGYALSLSTASLIAVRIGQGIAILFIIWGVRSENLPLVFIGGFVILAGQSELKMVGMMRAPLRSRPSAPPPPPPYPASPDTSAGQDQSTWAMPPVDQIQPIDDRDVFTRPRGL